MAIENEMSTTPLEGYACENSNKQSYWGLNVECNPYLWSYTNSYKGPPSHIAISHVQFRSFQKV